MRGMGVVWDSVEQNLRDQLPNLKVKNNIFSYLFLLFVRCNLPVENLSVSKELCLHHGIFLLIFRESEERTSTWKHASLLN